MNICINVPDIIRTAISIGIGWGLGALLFWIWERLRG